VVGFLKTITNIQVLEWSSGQSSRMHEITIENLSMIIQGKSPYLRKMPPKSTLMPPLHIVIPTKQGKLPIHFNPDNRKTISQLLSAKWDPSCQ
ncbi:hypothetical protein MKX03_011067, partial [Papaver bracteatum]